MVARDLLNFAPLTWQAYTPKPQEDATNPPAPPMTADVAVSSLGNLKDLVKAERGPLSISGVWVAGVGVGHGREHIPGGLGR